MQASYRTFSNDSNNQGGHKLPKTGQRVMVTTINFRCLGYLDNDGVWRQSFNNKPLEKVLEWEPIGDISKN